MGERTSAPSRAGARLEVRPAPARASSRGVLQAVLRVPRSCTIVRWPLLCERRIAESGGSPATRRQGARSMLPPPQPLLKRRARGVIGRGLPPGRLRGRDRAAPWRCSRRCRRPSMRNAAARDSSSSAG